MRRSRVDEHVVGAIAVAREAVRARRDVALALTSEPSVVISAWRGRWGRRRRLRGHAALGLLRALVAAVVSVIPGSRLCRRGALVAAALVARAAPTRRPARRQAALRLREVATPPTHAVMVMIRPRLRASGAELRAARGRIASVAPAIAVVAVVPARPPVSRRHFPAALVQLACVPPARLPRISHVVVDHAQRRALRVVEGVLARWLAALILIACAIGARVMIPRAPRGATGGGALVAAAGVAVVAPAR